MASGTWLLTAATWGSLLGGVVVTIAGIVLLGLMLFGRGVPVGGAGAFTLLTLGAGPLFTVLGLIAIVAGWRLSSGVAWPRAYLEVFFWIVTLTICGYIGYEGSRLSRIRSGHMVRGALYFTFFGLPPIAMAIVLRAVAR